MLRLRTLLVDDEPLALDLLRVECERFAFIEILGAARDGLSAALALERTRPDLVLLDIEMPGIDGLALAAGATPPAPQFVFITAHAEYAVNAFGLEATDYLLKPVSSDRLALAFERVRRRMRQTSALKRIAPAHEDANQGVLWLKGRNGYVQVDHRDIQWIQAERDFVQLHTADHAYLFRSTLAAMRARLGESVMLQVHRSAAVRRSAIRDIRSVAGGQLIVVLEDGAEISVGRRHRAAVAEVLGVPLGRSRRGLLPDGP